jgi:hypothetical protein
MRQKSLMGSTIEVLACGCEFDVQTATVIGVRRSRHQSLRFQLIDDSSDRAQSNAEFHCKLGHGMGTPEIQEPKAIRLRDGQLFVEALVQVAELIERGNFVQHICEPVKVFVRHHQTVRYTYNTGQVLNEKSGLSRAARQRRRTERYSPVRIKTV